MTIIQFHSNILQFSEAEIIALISENRKELKLLFINLNIDHDNTELLGQILVHLAALELTEEGKKSEEIQFLFTELAFYFKWNNNHGFVVYALQVITDSVLKNRLNAWIQIKLYAAINSNITRFREYLQKFQFFQQSNFRGDRAIEFVIIQLTLLLILGIFTVFLALKV
jgi:hypothetical protein